MDKKSQVIHLYEFDQQTVNQKELTQKILEALKPYLGSKEPDIKIRGRTHKYWAYFEAEPQICNPFLTQVKSSTSSRLSRWATRLSTSGSTTTTTRSSSRA